MSLNFGELFWMKMVKVLQVQKENVLEWMFKRYYEHQFDTECKHLKSFHNVPLLRKQRYENCSSRNLQTASKDLSHVETQTKAIEKAANRTHPHQWTSTNHNDISSFVPLTHGWNKTLDQLKAVYVAAKAILQRREPNRPSIQATFSIHNARYCKCFIQQKHRFAAYRILMEEPWQKLIDDTKKRWGEYLYDRAELMSKAWTRHVDYRWKQRWL